jgi:serine/threonine protein kinase/ankyrin repeat protein
MEALHQPGDIIAERYRITDTLGQGGVGITYKAEDLKSGQQVALKAQSVRQMGEWKVLELFEREARILAQLNHPAIPRYLDYFQVDSSEDRAFYITQELVEGKSLADLVKDGWRTNESGVRQIATQILEILVYLHDLKPPVVHRDIKPQNLILGKDGKIFLVDFGAVQDTYRSTFAKGSTIVGTYGYMAPEQFRGQAVPATDLYGLGATILFLLTHRSPSELPQERLKISFRSRIQVSDGFADWLEKMLEPDVEDRFSSAKDALKALRGRLVVAKSPRSVWWMALVGLGVSAVASSINPFGWTGICEAARSGNIDIVSRIYLYGGVPTNNMRALDKGRPVTTCLLRTDKKDLAELVISRFPDVKFKDDRDRTLLHHAGSKQVAELLIAKGADINVKDAYGNTPLHYAGSKEVAELLIAKGADINAKGYKRKTPLHYAGSKEVAELLIAKGADVNAKDNGGRTPLHDAGWKEMAELRIGNQKEVSVNQARLVIQGLELLIAKGADVNAKEVAELLIAKGADINAKDNDGNTPLHSTTSKEVAELLIAQGADVNAKNNSGDTPLHVISSRLQGHHTSSDVAIAITNSYRSVIELLKSHGGKD